MAELRLIIQNGQLLAFLGLRATKYFVSGMHRDTTLSGTVTLEERDGWLEYFFMYFPNLMHILLTNKVTLCNGQSPVDHYVRKTAFCLFV